MYNNLIFMMVSINAETHYISYKIDISSDDLDTFKDDNFHKMFNKIREHHISKVKQFLINLFGSSNKNNTVHCHVIFDCLETVIELEKENLMTKGAIGELRTTMNIAVNNSIFYRKLYKYIVSDVSYEKYLSNILYFDNVSNNFIIRSLLEPNYDWINLPFNFKHLKYFIDYTFAEYLKDKKNRDYISNMLTLITGITKIDYALENMSDVESCIDSLELIPEDGNHLSVLLLKNGNISLETVRRLQSFTSIYSTRKILVFDNRVFYELINDIGYIKFKRLIG